MDDIYNEINKIEYLFIKDCQLIFEDIPVELFNESNNNKLCKILDILYSLKDKINNKLIIDFIFETKDEKEIPKKISFYQYILLSFYTFINIYFNQRQFIIIRFPQIFQVNDNHQIINFDYKIKLNLLNNIISFNDKEFTKYIKSNNELLSIFKQILSQIDEGKLLNKYNLFHYPYTCLAGTFDRCHLGHLFLIQTSLLLSKSHYFIGVCSDDMIKHKGPFSLIQPNFIRRKKIEEIINLNGHNNYNCLYEVNTIYDAVDMAGRDKDLKCLIVTTETYKGGLYCNEIRKKNNLNEVDICTINVININLDDINKISSSLIRKDILNIISIEKINKLYSYFSNLCMNLLKIENKNDVEYWWHEILENYTKKWKFYHNLNHVYSFVNLFEKYNKFINNYKNEFLISIYFHDIIYIPSRNDNEEESINMFNKFYNEVKPNNINKEKVIEFIVETKNHSLSKDYDFELDLFLDMDMQIVADENWEDYENKIRKEYCFVDETEYKNKRKQFLQGLVNKNRIFRTQIFYDTYEQIAKNNITNIINKLK
jgi:predicted metal-dependent HD superfamily phosphohydrolase/phosphopantetheine adenylyltransferase